MKNDSLALAGTIASSAITCVSFVNVWGTFPAAVFGALLGYFAYRNMQLEEEVSRLKDEIERKDSLPPARINVPTAWTEQQIEDFRNEWQNLR